MSVLRRGMFAATLAVAMTVASPAPAQTEKNFPSKPLRLVVPFSAGSGVDIMARIAAQKMTENWGQPVVLENRSGGGGRLGAAIVAKSSPDGHTLLWTSSAFTISAALFKDLPYDPIKDFAGVTRIGIGTGAIVVSPALGITNVQDFIAFAKARPGKIYLGSSGAGSATHMTSERFRLGAGISSVHVGFKGPSEVVVEIVAGRIHFGYVGLMTAMPFIKEGKLLALAVNTMQRSPHLPDVPAMPEVLPDWVREGAQSLLAPAATPRPVLRKLSKEIARILELPDVKERMHAVGFVPDPCTPEEHDRFIRAQIESFSGIIRLAGLRAP